MSTVETNFSDVTLNETATTTEVKEILSTIAADVPEPLFNYTLLIIVVGFLLVNVAILVTGYLYNGVQESKFQLKADKPFNDMLSTAQVQGALSVQPSLTANQMMFNKSVIIDRPESQRRSFKQQSLLPSQPNEETKYEELPDQYYTIPNDHYDPTNENVYTPVDEQSMLSESMTGTAYSTLPKPPPRNPGKKRNSSKYSAMSGRVGPLQRDLNVPSADLFPDMKSHAPNENYVYVDRTEYYDFNQNKAEKKKKKKKEKKSKKAKKRRD